MSTVPFDTHAFYLELVESRLAEKTADGLTKAMTKIKLAKPEDLATKRDLKELELKIAENKAELVRWVVGVGLLQITIIVGLVFRLADKL